MKRNLKPKNPYVAASLFRQAGAHKKTNKAKRRQEKVAFAQQLKKDRHETLSFFISAFSLAPNPKSKAP